MRSIMNVIYEPTLFVLYWSIPIERVSINVHEVPEPGHIVAIWGGETITQALFKFCKSRIAGVKSVDPAEFE